MYLQKLKHLVSRNLANAGGWKTQRKIVVFESDDWGSIRMPSGKVFEEMLNHGVRVDKCPYNKYDSIESEEDLSALFEILQKFSDKNENHPVITANTVVANPDFEKINATGFQEYHYELFTETLKKYPGRDNSFALITEGIKKGVYFPQFHGREHLNFTRWLRYLREGSAETRLAFENRMFGISTTISRENRKSFLAALDYDSRQELTKQEETIRDGINCFEQVFGFRPESFIAPNYLWPSTLESKLAKCGIKYIQGSGGHKIPAIDGNKTIRHPLGSKNAYGQIYLRRNCVFEPTLTNNPETVEKTLREIDIAFSWSKPVVISTHRVNYMGSLDSQNRTRSLKMLQTLLRKILAKYPDVEFMTSNKLGALIEKNKKYERN
jgi:hypothetical protein